MQSLLLFSHFLVDIGVSYLKLNLPQRRIWRLKCSSVALNVAVGFFVTSYVPSEIEGRGFCSCWLCLSCLCKELCVQRHLVLCYRNSLMCLELGHCFSAKSTTSPLK